MKGFVNFGKRGVQLPAGCKDLIDVLHPPKNHSMLNKGFGSSESLANHVSKLLESEVKSRTLVITWNEMNYLQLMYDRGALSAFVIVHENTNREQPIRDLFHSFGLAPILDEVAAGRSVRMLAFDIKNFASRLTELVPDLLRRGFGLPENTNLEMRVWENTIA